MAIHVLKAFRPEIFYLYQQLLTNLHVLFNP